jgi:hypothetical protein
MLSRKHKKLLECRDLANKSLSDQTINAAALQNEIANRYKLQGTKPAHKVQSIAPTNRQNPATACAGCGARQSTGQPDCEQCGIFFRSNIIVPETLAQKRGLVKKVEPPPAMTIQEWNVIECLAKDREDAHCPICMSGFNQGSEVLLSCSHMFHRSCLSAFEKFMKTSNRSCPLCR